MDNFRYVNAGDSTLSAGIVAADTQFTVANPARFPSSLGSGETLVLTLHPSGLPSTQEIVICTAISGGTMTVTRGAQGTSAQDWPSETVVGAYLTAEMLGQIRDKALTVSGTNTGDETAARIGTLTAGATAKATPVDADLIGLADSAASNTLKKLSWSALKAALKTYFDTLYNLYLHPNHSGDVTSVADGAQTIAANAVTNAKLADMANGAIKGRVTSGAGDPEDLTATQVRTILNVADGAQKNSNILKSEIEAVLTGELSSHSHAAVTPGYRHAAGSAIYRASEADDMCAAVTSYEAIPGYGGFTSMTPADDHGWYNTTGSHTDRAVQMDHAGTVTASVQLKRAVSTGTAYVRVCKNGAVIQEFSQTSESYATHTVNLDVQPGDIITFQRKSSSSSVSTSTTRNHRILITQPT